MAGRIAALVAVLLAAGCGSGGERRRVEPTPQAVLGPGRLVDIGGGRSLYLRCSGSGSPTVVLEAGYGATTDTWSAVEPALGRITRTCAYDRAGLGNSTAIPGVHDAGDEVADLSRLLQHAGVRPPYVVVGHSYGGLLARLFAGTNRGQVGGVVLVDPIGSDFERRLLQWWRSQPAAVRRKLPRPKPNAVTDGVDFAAGAALARRVESLGDLPLVLISRGLPDEGTAGFGGRVRRVFEDRWAAAQGEYLRLSGNTVHVAALRSAHGVQQAGFGQPDVVVRAVRAAVRAARGDGALPACRDVFDGSGTRCR